MLGNLFGQRLQQMGQQTMLPQAVPQMPMMGIQSGGRMDMFGQGQSPLLQALRGGYGQR